MARVREAERLRQELAAAIKQRDTIASWLGMTPEAAAALQAEATVLTPEEEAHARELLANVATPEPAPVPGGREVTPLLIAWLRAHVSDLVFRETLIGGLQARDTYGRAKYGQPLMTHDGRDDRTEVLQEVIDAIQYAFKARLNGGQIPELLPFVDLLRQLVVERGAVDPLVGD